MGVGVNVGVSLGVRVIVGVVEGMEVYVEVVAEGMEVYVEVVVKVKVGVMVDLSTVRVAVAACAVGAGVPFGAQEAQTRMSNKTAMSIRWDLGCLGMAFTHPNCSIRKKFVQRFIPVRGNCWTNGGYHPLISSGRALSVTEVNYSARKRMPSQISQMG